MVLGIRNISSKDNFELNSAPIAAQDKYSLMTGGMMTIPGIGILLLGLILFI
jgi:hypothetical protein